MNRIAFLLLIILTLSSCFENKEEKVEYYKFQKQITPSGKFAIYDYGRYGAMAFSSDIVGKELFQIDKEFKEGKGQKIYGAISHWINDDTLLVYDFRSELEQPLDTFPINITYRNLGDFVLKTVNYKSNSGGMNRYEFDSVWTNANSIYLRFFSNSKKKNVRSFPLGSVSIKTNSDSIRSIEIFGELTKHMNFLFKNPDGTLSKNLPGIGTTYYEYTPTKKISPKDLNKEKIFYEKY